MELQNVHRRVRQARAETGLSQKAFAEKLGVAREVLARWENGETKKPDVHRLAEFTGKPLAWFWSEDVEEPPLGGSGLVSDSSGRVPATVEQLTQVVVSLTELVRESQQQNNRLLDRMEAGERERAILYDHLAECQRLLGHAMGLPETERGELRRTAAAGGTSGHPGRPEGKAAS